MKKMFLIQEGEMTGLYPEISKQYIQSDSQCLINEKQFNKLLLDLKDKKLLDENFEWTNEIEEFYILSKVGVEVFEYLYQEEE